MERKEIGDSVCTHTAPVIRSLFHFKLRGNCSRAMHQAFASVIFASKRLAGKEKWVTDGKYFFRPDKYTAG